MYSFRNLYFVYNDICIKHFLSLVFNYQYFSSPIISIKFYGLKFVKYYFLVYFCSFVFIYIFYRKFYNIFFPNWVESEKVIESVAVKRPEILWDEFQQSSVAYFFTKSTYYIEWLYKYYYLSGARYPFKELYNDKNSVIYKFIEQSKESKFGYLLYYHPESEYHEVDKGEISLFQKKLLKVTNKFLNYLKIVNSLMFNSKMYIFSDDHGVYKYMNKKYGKDEILYEFFIYYNFNTLFVCFFY